jgi:hypothetical protein
MYYTKWDDDTAFGMCLDDVQCVLVRSNVTIADEEKLQFYLEEMYDSNHFDKNEMLNWEQQATATKTNYKLAKQYFEALVKATDTYKQNAGRGTPGQNKYKSANQLTDCGNEIRNYIAQIACATVANNDHAANTQSKDTQFDVMSVQIKALIEAVAKLTANKGNKNVNPNTNNSNKGNSKRRHQGRPQPQQLSKLRIMGGYCHSHGFHSVSAGHNSKNCNWKTDKNLTPC